MMAAATLTLLAAMFVIDTGPLRALFAIGVVLSAAVPGNRHWLPVFVGGVSYPLYLNHWMGAYVAHGLTRHLLHAPEGTLAGTALFVALAYTSSLAFGAVAYWFIDRQVLARRQRWFTRFRGLACGATAYSLVAIGVIGGTLSG